MPTEKKTIPDISNVSIFARRYIEAAILKNVFDEISVKFGVKAAEEIIGKACSNSAIAHGAMMADLLEKKPDLGDFSDILPNWTKEEALEIEVLDEAASVMNFNVTRCRYADFCKGYNSEIQFERTQTIMKGAKYCDFRLKLER
jgi:hypothetical protein